MKKKHLLVLAVSGLLIGYILLNPLTFGFCTDKYMFNGRVGCISEMPTIIGELIIIFSIPLFIVSIALIFVKEKTFCLWIKFFRWWFPLSIIATLLSSSASGGYLFPSDRTIVAVVFLGIFILGSFVIMIYGSYKSHINREKLLGNE